MKKTTLAACTLAALIITFASCDWFSKKSSNTAPSIVGKWKVDSFHVATNDTVISILLYNLATKGKDSSVLQFNADSTFIELPQEDISPKKFYVKGNEISFEEDSIFKFFRFEFKGDSTVSLLAKDSTTFVLKRK